MSITLDELAENLKRVDEVTLLELLEIDSEILIDRFMDIVEDKFDKLEEEIQ